MSREVERAWRVRGMRTALCTEKNEEKGIYDHPTLSPVQQIANRSEAWFGKTGFAHQDRKVVSAKNG